MTRYYLTQEQYEQLKNVSLMSISAQLEYDILLDQIGNQKVSDLV
jgi:hypothetical protein